MYAGYTARVGMLFVLALPEAAGRDRWRCTCVQADDLRSVRSVRGGLYAAFAVLFFVEGIALMLAPAQTLQARRMLGSCALCTCSCENRSQALPWKEV